MATKSEHDLLKEIEILRSQIDSYKEKEEEHLKKMLYVMRLERVNQATIDMIPDLLVVKDHEFVYQTVNKAFCKRLAKEKDEILGRTDFELFSEKKASKYRKDDLKVIESRRLSRVDQLVEGKTDDWVEATKIPIFDDSDNFVALYTIVRDINARKQLEKTFAMKESYRLLHDITANLPCIINQIHLSPYKFPVFSFVSDAVKDMYGLNPAEVIEDANLLFQHIHEDDAEKVGESIREACAKGTPWSFDFRIIAPSGKLKWINTTAAPQKMPDGQLVWNGFFLDITDKKKVEELRRDIDRITKHDLKTPLSSIIFLLNYMVKDDTLNKKQRESILILERAAYKMADLINVSLNLYKIEQGTYKLTKLPVDVLHTVENVLIDLKEPVENKRLSIEVLLNNQPVTEDNSFFVSGEEVLIYSMLANLIKNAVEASPEGETVKISLLKNESLEIHIQNCGVVPEEVRDKFFEKYSTFGKSRGIGIGTYSAAEIAKVHGAHIKMETSDKENKTIIHIKSLTSPTIKES